jgi:hypothetical protein
VAGGTSSRVAYRNSGSSAVPPDCSARGARFIKGSDEEKLFLTRQVPPSAKLFVRLSYGGSMKNIQAELQELRSEAAGCLLLSNLTTDPERRMLFARLAELITGLASAVQNEVAAEPTNVVPAADTAVVNQKLAISSRQILRGLVAVVLFAAAGALVWPRAEDTKQAIAKLQSAEEETRRTLSEQLGALAERVANLEKARAEIVEPTTKRDPESARPPRHRKDQSVNGAPGFRF